MNVMEYTKEIWSLGEVGGHNGYNGASDSGFGLHVGGGDHVAGLMNCAPITSSLPHYRDAKKKNRESM